uniref:Uncharacterized protein n=1 Tax=Cyprinus carpio TaxID=7962 RepID=A0A8C1ZCM8_CYPCA
KKSQFTTLKHSRMTALLERLHSKHNSSRSWQETSKVVRQAMEKRGVSNTAGHQLLLNSVETLQRALKGEFNYILIKLIHLALRYSSVISTLKGT